MEQNSFLKPRTISAIKDFVCVLPALVFLGIFTYYPICKLIQISFTDWNLLNDTWNYVGLKNWIWLFNGFGTKPKDYYEAASLDGATAVQSFFKITLPMLSPTTLFLFVTTFISSMKVFQSVDILTSGGPYRATEVFVYTIYKYAMEDFRMDRASVVAIAFFVLLLIVTASTFKISSSSVHYDS